MVEPYLGGSHAAWAYGYQAHSRHQVALISHPDRFWKWRMHGGAVTLARQFLRRDRDPDLIVATDMLDLTTFLALTRHKTARLPVVIYFHENQICYPWSPKDRDILQKRDHHYGFINYSSALAADLVVFNSVYHQTAFFDALPRFLKQFPEPHDLISQKRYPDIFYRNFDDLVEKLADALLSIETIRQQSFRHCVESYSWQHMAPVYDTIFGAVQAWR